MRARLVAAALAAMLAAGGVDGARAVEPVVLADGHVDYGARLIDGRLQSQVKDSTAGAVVWREPADVTFHVRPEARTTLPADERLAFLGRPGDPVWILPQTQRAGLLWPGWNTEEIRAGEVAGPVTWRLVGVEGPGAAAIYTIDAFGRPAVLFNSGDGLPDARDVPLGTHAHGNWAFTRPGTYRLTFEMTARLASGATTTDVEPLAVTVADRAPGTVPPPGGSPPGGGSTEPGTKPDAVRPTLRVSRARLRGRSLTLRLGLSERSRVTVAVRRRGRTAARAKARSVAAGTRTLRVRLDRRLAPGRYSVRVRADARSVRLAEAVILRVTNTTTRRNGGRRPPGSSSTVYRIGQGRT